MRSAATLAQIIQVAVWGIEELGYVVTNFEADEGRGRSDEPGSFVITIAVQPAKTLAQAFIGESS